MKKTCKLLAALLLLTLLLSLFSVSAFAANNKSDKAQDSELSDSADSKTVEKDSEPKADEKKEAESEKKDEASKNPQIEEEPETVTVKKGETYYAESGFIVFNNGGTVYNNDATVYNNGGIVYNNLGVVYNNGGTVYANGGTVYNNTGTVYNNGAELFGHEDKEETPAQESPAAQEAEEEAVAEASPAPEDSAPADEAKEEKDSDSEDSKEPEENAVPETSVKEGFYKLNIPQEYNNYIVYDGQDEAEVFYVGKDESFSFSLKPGYELSEYALSSGELKDNKDGSFTIKKLSKDAELELEFRLSAPVFNIESGSYLEPQTLEIEAAEDADIYYTTDGEEPSEDSEKYSEPIELEDGAVIRAIAVSSELEASKEAKVKIAIVDVDVPGFKNVKEGYKEIEPKGIEVENDGDVDASIKKISISGEHAKYFKLSTTSGKSVKAGTTEEKYWNVGPVSGLEAGEYSAIITVLTDNDVSADYPLRFTVK